MFFCTSRVIPLMVYDKPYRNEKHVLLREHHGNFFNREKSATVPTKPFLSKVSVVFPFRDFLGRIQNRRCHLDCVRTTQTSWCPWWGLKSTMLEVPKELSKSNRKGTAPKLKSMVQPYKTKFWKKVDRIRCWDYRDW